jgi:hypothetical protein
MQAGRNDNIPASYWTTTGRVIFIHTLPDKLDNAVTNHVNKHLITVRVATDDPYCTSGLTVFSVFRLQLHDYSYTAIIS